MKHLDLFSGIGGASLALDQVFEGVEHEFCEIDPFCQAVLHKHWPHSKIYEDIKELNPGPADIITGGFPCQPFSSAGLQRGKDDDRDLWPEMFRVIKQARPSWVIGENVAGFVNMELERSVLDLESEGYEVQPFVIPACAVQAPHRRDRVWIIAYSASAGNLRGSKKVPRKNGRSKRHDISKSHDAVSLSFSATNAADDHVQRSFEEQESGLLAVGADPFLEAWEASLSLLPEAVLCRSNDGVPHRVYRTKALGNAWVPQVAIEIFKAIKSTGPL